MKNFSSIIFMITALGLMCLPSVRVHFADGFTVDYSYYNLFLLFGGAIYFPMLTFIFSIIITVLLTKINESSNLLKEIKNLIKILLIICVILSLVSWFFVKTFTIIGLIIALLHVSTLALQIIHDRHI